MLQTKILELLNAEGRKSGDSATGSDGGRGIDLPVQEARLNETTSAPEELAKVDEWTEFYGVGE